jgi:hypothetical protein
VLLFAKRAPTVPTSRFPIVLLSAVPSLRLISLP